MSSYSYVGLQILFLPHRHGQQISGLNSIRLGLGGTGYAQTVFNPTVALQDDTQGLPDLYLFAKTVRPHGHRELAHPEVGYYTVGAKSYGRAPTFLMATGYEQVRSIVAALAGDFAAADEVQLDLPQTGVLERTAPNSNAPMD